MPQEVLLVCTCCRLVMYSTFRRSSLIAKCQLCEKKNKPHGETTYKGYTTSKRYNSAHVMYLTHIHVYCNLQSLTMLLQMSMSYFRNSYIRDCRHLWQSPQSNLYTIPSPKPHPKLSTASLITPPPPLPLTPANHCSTIMCERECVYVRE